MRCAIATAALALALTACGSEQPPADEEPSSPAGDLTIPSASPASSSTESASAPPQREAPQRATAGSSRTPEIEVEVEVVSTKVKGPYPADVLERIVANQTEPIRWCVGREIETGADLDWKVTASFEVVPRSARLQNIEVVSRELSDEAETCIAQRFGIARFPMIEIDKPTKVRTEISVRYSLTGSDGGTTK